MDGTIQAYVLDMAADTKKEPLRVKQYDTNSRQARITLKMGGEPWTIPFGAQIYINVRKTDGTLADATCTREDEHTVLAPITEQMTAVTGTQLGELYFLGSDGDIKSQSFPVVVYEAVMDQARMESSDDFQSLQDALRDVKTSTASADRATQYATEQGDQARDAAQRAEDAAASIQVAVDAAANAKACESNAKNSELAAAQTQQEVTDYVEAQKAAFAGYSKRESDSKYANALTETVTGEGSVTVEDAWTAPVLGLDVVGKSEQVTTTGANLFDIVHADNIKGVASGDELYYIRVGQNSAWVESTKIPFAGESNVIYTLSAKVKCGTATNLGIAFCYSDGTFEMSNRVNDTTYGEVKVTSKADKTVNGFGFIYVSADTSGYIKDIQLQKGSTATTFEPYTGGAPSPSPDYPQDIISVGTVSMGKQMFYKSLVTLQGTGAEADIIDKRAIKITYTRANGGKYAGFIVDDKSNIVGKTLTISYGSVIPSKSDLTPGIRLYWIDNNGYVLSSAVYANKSPTTITIEDPQNDRVTKLALLLYADIGDTAVLNDYVIYKDIMINAGDTALPWEPYTGGKPSPSVEYPAELEVGVTGANLLDIDLKHNTGISITNSNGEIKINGTTGTIGDSDIYIIGTFGNSTVRFSGLNTYQITGLTNDENVYLINASTVKKGITGAGFASYDGDIACFMVRLKPGKTYNNMVIYPMVCAGDSALPWEPYQSKSASITLIEPLRSIGDYRDRIMCRDGVWGIERWLYRVDYDGSEDEAWSIQSMNDKGITNYTISLKAIAKNNIKGALCTCLQYDPSWIADATRNGIIIDSGSSLYIRLKEVKTVEALKTWLSGNPVTAIYPLATPTWDPLPSATQQALNELTTYAGTTHLTITAGGPAPTVTLDYVKDTHKALEQCQEAAKEYTDNQIAAIVAALPTATQAAIVDNQITKLLQEV